MRIAKYKSKEEAKKAHKEKIRLWRLKNKDRIKLIVKEYHKKNPDIIEKSHKKYQTKNKDLILEKVRISNAKRLAEKKLSKNNYLKKEKKSKEDVEKIFNEQIRLLRIRDKEKKESRLLQKKLKRNPPQNFRKILIINCSYCKKLFSTKKSFTKFCSKKCASAHQINFRKTPEYKKRVQEIRRKMRKNSPDKIKKHLKKYYSTEKGQITRLWDTLRNRVKIYTFSKRKSSRKDMDSLVGCSRLFLLKYIETKFYDHPVTNKKMTWSNTKDWHIDHITPLAILDPKNEEHFKIANHFSNLQPLWAEENLKKSYKVISGYGVAHLKRKFYKIQKFGENSL
jgi:endogenous inhibitor of DNA gyrase (YacG/DUF329 family)